jgi:GTPase SAR1 family protein
MTKDRFIINIRGGGGSGKTTLARRVLEHKVADLEPWPFEKREGGSKGTAKPALWPVAKCVVPGIRRPVYVQGSYTQAQGGCDTCKDMDAIERLIRRASEELTDGHVLFEGKFVSGSAERWCQFKTRAERDGLGRFLWVFLTLERDELIKRIMERNGGKMPIVQHLEGDIQNNRNSRRCAMQISERRFVVDIDPRMPAADVFAAFVGAIGGLEESEKP